MTTLREGYGAAELGRDALAGLTVAIVALPLSMALAIASGVSPDSGLYAAIVAGFLISALGGSRFQIGGPAGAFIVLVSAAVSRHGVDGMLLATMIAGLILIVLGALRIGGYIKLIPYPVTVGFTAGIAVIIMASQVSELLGLRLDQKEPGDLIPKLEAIWAGLDTLNPSALGIAVLTIACVLLVRRFFPRWPAFLIAVVLATVVATSFSFPVDTIGTRFGGIPRTLPWPSLPEVTPDRILAVLPDALAFALLGAIESLLSAVVADGMTGRRHRSSMELVAQGVANIVAPLFGGMMATGTLARTATNIRAGAHGPVAGMLHSVFLLGFMLVAAPLASFVPLAALAGLLAVVAWNMVERHAFAALMRSSVGDAVVLLATLALVIFRDLMTGIVIGFALSALLFIHRMSGSASVEAGMGDGPHFDSDPGIVVCRVSGAFFFGSAAAVGSALDRIGDRPHTFVLDCSQITTIDSTAANVIEGLLRKAKRSDVRFVIAAASSEVRTIFFAHGVRPPDARYKATLAAAVGNRGAGGRQAELPSPHTTAL